MINNNLIKGQMIEQEPCSYKELEKATELIGLVVLDESQLSRFIADVDKLIEKGQSSALSTEEALSLEKAQRDMSKLVKKTITDKSGRKTTKWVKASSSEAKDDKSGAEGQESPKGGSEAKPDTKDGDKKYNVHHAKDTDTSKLEKYIKDGEDEDLKAIAREELRKRKSEESKNNNKESKGSSTHKVGDEFRSKIDGNRHVINSIKDGVVITTSYSKTYGGGETGGETGGHNVIMQESDIDVHKTGEGQTSYHKKRDEERANEKAKALEGIKDAHSKLKMSKDFGITSFKNNVISMKYGDDISVVFGNDISKDVVVNRAGSNIGIQTTEQSRGGGYMLQSKKMNHYNVSSVDPRIWISSVSTMTPSETRKIAENLIRQIEPKNDKSEKGGNFDLIKSSVITFDSLVSDLFMVQNKLEHCHRLTKSEPIHKALGDAYDAISGIKDTLIEGIIGAGGQRYKSVTLTSIPEYTPEMCNEVAEEIVTVAKGISEFAKSNSYSFAENISQDIDGIGAKLKYKLSLNKSDELAKAFESFGL